MCLHRMHEPGSWPRIAVALLVDGSLMLTVQVKCHKEVVPGSFKHVAYLLEQEAICCCCSSGEIILLHSSTLELEEARQLPCQLLMLMMVPWVPAREDLQPLAFLNTSMSESL